MAGSYPDAPSRRMAWDEDKTVFMYGSTVASSGQRIEVNDEDYVGWSPVGYPGGGEYFYWFFPELREIDGWAGRDSTNSALQNVWTSTNTTNTVDGTWVDQGVSGDRLHHRNDILSLGVSFIRCVRVGTTGGWGVALDYGHWYGEIAPGETPDRLLFIDSVAALEFGLPIDYGDVPRGSASDYLIKLRNNSGSLTASVIQITGESLYLNSGSWFTFSEGGGFQATLPLGSSIGPGSDSPVITARRVIPGTETVGLHAGRFQASVGSW